MFVDLHPHTSIYNSILPGTLTKHLDNLTSSPSSNRLLWPRASVVNQQLLFSGAPSQPESSSHCKSLLFHPLRCTTFLSRPSPHCAFSGSRSYSPRADRLQSRLKPIEILKTHRTTHQPPPKPLRQHLYRQQGNQSTNKPSANTLPRPLPLLAPAASSHSCASQSKRTTTRRRIRQNCAKSHNPIHTRPLSQLCTISAKCSVLINHGQHAYLRRYPPPDLPPSTLNKDQHDDATILKPDCL